jgi:nicotinamidase/pyrazinamidase
MNRRVLLVIDVLNDFLNPQGALYCGEHTKSIVPVIRALIDRFQSAGDPVIYLCDAHAPDDKEFELFAMHAVKDTWGSQIISELRPPEGSMVIGKARFSGLYGNRLPQILETLRSEEVWVAGVCTSICIMDTVGDLRNRDYRVVVPVDAVADFDPVFHEFALKRMERVYGTKLITASS